MSDLDYIKKIVEPLAAQAGIFRGRVLAMFNEDNMTKIYLAVGAKGIREAAEAIIRIGERHTEPDIRGGVNNG